MEGFYIIVIMYRIKKLILSFYSTLNREFPAAYFVDKTMGTRNEHCP